MAGGVSYRVPDAVQRVALLRRAGTIAYGVLATWAPALQRITACCAASGARESDARPYPFTSCFSDAVAGFLAPAPTTRT